MTIKNFLLNFLFPPRCVNCGRLGRYLCQRCTSEIKIIEQQVCPVCERPAVNGQTHPKCQTKFSLDGLTSFFVYDGPIKKAIKKLKYQFVTDLANELISLTNVISTARDDKCIFVPVPLHWRRLNWRGFNQSELLGKLMSARLKVRFAPDLLIRKKYTQPQVKLKGKERKENIQDAFVVNPKFLKSLVSSLQFLVFDDVWTTGSTLKTCGKVLKEAGAKKVCGMTLAR